jgi:hypothetical protein
MRIARLLALPLLLVGLMLATGARHAMADPRDFTLVNGTSGVSFSAVFVAPSASNDWEDNLIPSNAVVMPGGQLNITFGRYNPNTCTYDIMVQGYDSAGNPSSGELDNVNLCTTTTVTFSVS